MHDFTLINDELDSIPFIPSFMILISPVITMDYFGHKGSLSNLLGEKPEILLIKRFSCEQQVTKSTPPAFIVHTANDHGVSVMNSVLFYEALCQKGILSSLHIFPYGGHHIYMNNNPGSTELCVELCEKWLKEMSYLK